MLHSLTIRNYCFSCGVAVQDQADRVAPLCARCAQSGPQIPREALRWMVRVGDGRALGPLAFDSVADQVRRGAVGPDDLAARVGGPWFRVVEHPDFGGWFLPGSELSASRVDVQASDKKDQSRFDWGKRLRAAGAVGLLGLTGAFALWSWSTGALLIPEAWTDQAWAKASAVRARGGDLLARALDEDAARDAVNKDAVLPGEALITQLAAAHPGIVGSVGEHITLGRMALWRGTRGTSEEARLHFEQALVLSPRDPEASGGLCEAYARLSATNAQLLEPMAWACTRTEALAPESIPALRGRSAAARASNDIALATDLASRCGNPPDLAGTPGSPTDLGCALAFASLSRNGAALAVLDERFTGVFPIQVARAGVALQRSELGLAMDLAAKLTKVHPDEPVPWRILSESYAAVGDWPQAIRAGERLRQLDPDDLEGRRQLAEVQLKVLGKPAVALAEMQAIIAHPNVDRFEGRVRLFTDAGAAALAVGDTALALRLADRAWQAHAGNPAAALLRARAAIQNNRPADAETALRAVEAGRLVGHDGARFRVAAARVYLAIGRERAADSEIDAAFESDPTYLDALLMSAHTRLAVGNNPGAVEQLQRAAWLDRSLAGARSPLQAIWFPSAGWGELRSRLERDLAGDVRYTSTVIEVVAILAWAADMPDAPRLLQRAIAAQPDTTAARAANASLLYAAGQHRAALQEVDRAIGANANTGVAYAIKARSLFALGRKEESDAAWVQAMQTGASVPAVHRWRAEALIEAGDTEGARREYGEVLRLVPDDLSARRALVPLR